LHVISRKRLKEASQIHADLEGPLATWYKIASKAMWTCLDDIRKTWRDTDPVGENTVFNIKGNSYRLIARINYRSQTMFIKAVVTHADYDKEDWK
jgi:mRNA interferase HigB